MVNPPRDEIRKIRAQLQEYGQVGDANVFYWFQNRKSRSKHKQRQLTQNNKSHQTTSSSSSSSDKSSQNNNSKNVEKALSVSSSSAMNIDLLTEPLFYPVRQNSGGRSICFPDVSSSSCGADQSVGNCSSVLLRELMLMRDGNWKKGEDEKMRLQEQLIYGVTTVVDHTADHFVPPPPTNHLLPGILCRISGIKPPKTTTVFINDVCFEVAMGQFNVRETFGDDVVLLQSTGQPVVTNEWGLTQQPLQHGAFYYLLRTFTPSPDDNTIHLI
ncbi:hypothetical protein DH2020_009002 [Rehmannia glutinosa]|uniref:Homeobox domain-containing protein n=1 Tax=Rehmannia glutinosa TaxID=99300 RepID=A0ABR0X886_REHGL